ncbi:MAG: hypothetical protein GY940_28740, partial [bacterium]|nr:hypothetical protein [bacterium]
MVAKIHKILNVKIPLTEVFTNPTIKKISQYIKTVETVAGDRFISIKASEGKEYYRLSSTQKRLYVLQQLDVGGTGYNIPVVVLLEGDLDRVRLEQTFRKLIARHDSLRTSFEMIGEEAVQKIHDEVELTIGHRSLVSGEEGSIETIIEDFVRP